MFREAENAASKARLEQIYAAQNEGDENILRKQRESEAYWRPQEERDTHMRSHSLSDMRLGIMLDNFGTYTMFYRKLNGTDVHFQCREFLDSGWPHIPVEHWQQLLPDVFLPWLRLGYMFSKPEAFVEVHLDFYCEISNMASDIKYPQNSRYLR